MTAANIFLGLMSGTSIDSVDSVAVNFDSGQCNLLGSHCHAMPAALKQDILDLCHPGADTVQLYAQTDHRLGLLFAEAALTLMADISLNPKCIGAIGCHGQTVRHAAPESNNIAFSLQIGDANIIAARTNCPVVADFRRKDMALGGQGAPLVPAFHRQIFARADKNRVIVNIGGIANITCLPALNRCTGFDTGPGNVLMDLWSQTHLGTSYDHHGDWAASGSAHGELLQQLKGCDFFAQPAPKSTGRELFNRNWLNSRLTDYTHLPPEDIQATLLALTATTICEAIDGLENPVEEVFICGGGAFNRALMSELTQRLPPITIATTNALGLDPNWVEACAFAWLAKQRMAHNTGNLVEVTGADRETILGAVYLP